MKLPEPLERHEKEEPRVIVKGDPDGVRERTAKRTDRGGPHHRQPAHPEHGKEEDEFESIPQSHRRPCRSLGRTRARWPIGQRTERGGLLFPHAITVQELIVESISPLLR